jgi:hypothetical protein
MPIKYGELTIIYNKEETSVFSSLLMWLSYDIDPPTKSNFVFLFEDGEICDTKDKLKDFKFKFFDSSFHKTPRYFEKKIENKENKHNKETQVYFHKDPTLNDKGQQTLDFRQLFASHSKYNSYTRIPSVFNSIYYCYKSSLKQEIFGIVRIKSTETMPQFLFAYDADEFTKEEVVYLINYIFNSSDRKNESKIT